MDTTRAILASHVNGRCFAPGVRPALERLGYRVVWASALAPGCRPSLRLADERHLGRLPDPGTDPETPIVLLGGSRPPTCWDRRVVGRVQRPVELRALYPILQQALEPHPRAAPRAPTRLSAQLGRADRRACGSVRVLSERGCLFEPGEPLPEDETLGRPLNLQLSLPSGERVSMRARGLYRAGATGGTALAFEDPAPDARERIARFVTARLATL